MIHATPAATKGNAAAAILRTLAWVFAFATALLFAAGVQAESASVERVRADLER